MNFAILYYKIFGNKKQKIQRIICIFTQNRYSTNQFHELIFIDLKY